MTSPPNGFDWENAGRELGASLSDYSALVVIGTDPVTTGQAAVGIARAQAMHRRVAVGDLFAESPPIQELVQTEDPHGLVDSFVYGVSLSRVAYPVRNSGELYVMPSGTEPPTYEEILPNPRWHRLAAGFREVRALLVLAAPAGAPHLAELVAATDGAILIGDAEPDISDAVVIASLREPARFRVSGTTAARASGAAPRVSGTAARMSGATPRVSGATPATPATPTATPAVPMARFSAKHTEKRRRIPTAAVAGIVLTVGLTTAAVWIAARPLGKSGPDRSDQTECDSTQSAPCVAPPQSPAMLTPPRDGGKRETVTTSGSVARVPTGPAAKIANPADSVSAAAYAVELSIHNTQAAAILDVQTDGKRMPAMTFSPFIVDTGRWFKVVTGAFTNKAEAESLLIRLNRQKMLRGGEHVVRLPFAILIDSVSAAAAPSAVPGMLASYADQGKPVYALRQSNGSAWLLIGAFESPEQASVNMESLRASEGSPKLVYRKGRPF